VAFIAFETFAEADLAATQANGLQIQEGDTLTVKLDNRTAQQVQESQNTKVAQSMIKSGQRPIAQQFTLTTPQFSPMPQFGMVQPQGQKAMRRITPAVPNTRFQPYQAPVVKPKPLALATNAAATPLPNGSDGNYCIFVYGVQANDIVEQLFAPFGTVASVRIQQGKKYGFVSMPHYNEVVNAINNLNGMTLRSGVTLQVRMATADATKNQ